MDASAGPPVVDAPYIRHWIHYRYQACGFQRYLSDSDMKVRPLLTAIAIGCTEEADDIVFEHGAEYRSIAMQKIGLQEQHTGCKFMHLSMPVSSSRPSCPIMFLVTDGRRVARPTHRCLERPLGINCCLPILRPAAANTWKACACARHAPGKWVVSGILTCGRLACRRYCSRQGRTPAAGRWIRCAGTTSGPGSLAGSRRCIR